MEIGVQGANAIPRRALQYGTGQHLKERGCFLKRSTKLKIVEPKVTVSCNAVHINLSPNLKELPQKGPK